MSKNILNLDGRQDTKTVLFEVTAANFAANGNNIDFEVEPGSIILAGRIKKLVAFDGTTDTYNFGTTDTPTNVGRLRVWLQVAKLGKADTTQGNASAPSVAPNPGPNY